MKTTLFVILAAIGFVAGFTIGFTRGAIVADDKIQELQGKVQELGLSNATCRLRLEDWDNSRCANIIDKDFEQQEVKSEDITL